MKNKIIVLLLIACCCLLSGCGEDGTRIVKNAYQNMNKWENYSYSMQTMADVNLPAVGHVKLVSASDGTTELKPIFLLKMNSDIVMQRNEENENIVVLEQYVVEQDENISIYHNSQGVWQKNIISSSNEVASIKKSPADIMKVYINAMTDADIVDEEIVNDVPCVKVKVTLSFDALSEIINNFDLAKIFGLNEEIAASLNSRSEINTMLWIGKENGMLYKQELDVSQLLKDFLASQLFEKGEDIGEVIMNMNIVYYDINTAEPIILPTELIS